MPRMDKIGKGNTTVRGSLVPNRQIKAGDPQLSVTLYCTEVVRVDGGIITLDTGGHFTVTTKNRMNQTANQFRLGFYVSQRAGAWFVTLGSGRDPIPFGDADTVSFSWT